MATKLRAVSPGETSKSSRVLSVTKAASEGTPRELLMAMRARVAQDVENPNTPSVALAALTRRLIEITKEIELIDVRLLEEGDGADATPDEAWTAV